jgi:hypothetical protein
MTYPTDRLVCAWTVVPEKIEIPPLHVSVVVRNSDDEAFRFLFGPYLGTLIEKTRYIIGRILDKLVADFLPRRNFLALSALGSGLAGLGASALVGAAPRQAQAAEPDGRSLMQIYADQDSRPDGEPVFWLTRGREYVVKGGIVTPLYDRHILVAARLIPQSDGGFKRPYTETAFATPPDQSDAPKMLKSPINGASYPNPFIHQLRLTLRVSPDGQIAQEVNLDTPKIHSTYNGRLTLVHSPEGKPQLASEINARAVSAAGVLDLTELGPIQAREDLRSNGFTPATREVIVLREAPVTLTGGAAALQIGIHPSKKFASIAEVTKVLTPEETEQYGPWLQNWEKLLYDPRDVILG